MGGTLKDELSKFGEPPLYASRLLEREYWDRAAASLSYLDPTDRQLNRALSDLKFAIDNYGFYSLDRPRIIREYKDKARALQRVAKNIRELERFLGDETFEWLCRDTRRAVQIELGRFRREVAFELPTYQQSPSVVWGKATIQFHRDVLDVWVKLGGKLGSSKDGPVARYFDTATSRIIGGSLENLPDIIARYRKHLTDLGESEEIVRRRGFLIVSKS